MKFTDGLKEQTIIDSIKQKQKQLGNKSVISILDASQDDIGARANYGRGNPSINSETAYDQFLMKFANF
jgi:hypothetical protein